METNPLFAAGQKHDMLMQQVTRIKEKHTPHWPHASDEDDPSQKPVQL